MGISPCCAKEGLNRGAWTALEDRTLAEYIKIHGEGGWRNLPNKAGLKRCGKGCRHRWLNYLRPDIKRGNISSDEEELIIRLHKLLGNRWSLIAGRLPGRTYNEIKNYWNTNLSKRVVQQQPRSSLSIGHGAPRSNKAKNVVSHSNVVIRTKATKCTKVFIDHPHLLQTKGLFFTDDHKPNNDHDQQALVADHNHHQQPNGNESLSDFLMDFDMNSELLWADFLESDFPSGQTQLHQLHWSDNVVFCGEDCVADDQLQPTSSAVLNFQSLSSFLEADANKGDSIELAGTSS